MLLLRTSNPSLSANSMALDEHTGTNHSQQILEETQLWRHGGQVHVMHSRLSLDDPSLDDHIKATIRRLSKFSAGSAGLPITNSEVDRLQKSYVSAYSTPLGDTIVEEGVIEYADLPDKSTSLDALDGPAVLDQSFVHPKVFTSPKTGGRNAITP